MTGDAVHTVLTPGLLCSARLYERVLPAVWEHGAATIADTRRDDTLPGIAARLLAGAPERFALAGLSMGGYVALEVMRQAPERVRALALISTSARPDTPEQSDTRRRQVAMTREGRFDEVVDTVFPIMVAASASEDQELHAVWSAMAHSVGPEAFCTQQAGDHPAAGLPAAAAGDHLPGRGRPRHGRPADRRRERRGAGRGHPPRAAHDPGGLRAPVDPRAPGRGAAALALS